MRACPRCRVKLHRAKIRASIIDKVDYATTPLLPPVNGYEHKTRLCCNSRTGRHDMSGSADNTHTPTGPVRVGGGLRAASGDTR